jgi:hypothetical protein
VIGDEMRTRHADRMLAWRGGVPLPCQDGCARMIMMAGRPPVLPAITMPTPFQLATRGAMTAQEIVTADDVLEEALALLRGRGYRAQRSTRSRGRAADLLGSFVYEDEAMPPEARRGTAEIERAIALLLPIHERADFDIRTLRSREDVTAREAGEILGRGTALSQVLSLLCDLRDANTVVDQD